jgi:hypothetical protein
VNFENCSAVVVSLAQYGLMVARSATEIIAPDRLDRRAAALGEVVPLRVEQDAAWLPSGSKCGNVTLSGLTIKSTLRGASSEESVPGNGFFAGCSPSREIRGQPAQNDSQVGRHIWNCCWLPG